MVGWLGSVGEFVGNLGASFLQHRARTKMRMIGASKADMDIAVYNAVNEGLLKDCIPIRSRH
jgi:hypothetical protein